MLFECIDKAEFYYPSRDWKHISFEAKDLIDRLLIRDPRRRYTAQQVLDHPWMQTPHNAGHEGEEQVAQDEQQQGCPEQQVAQSLAELALVER